MGEAWGLKLVHTLSPVDTLALTLGCHAGPRRAWGSKARH